MRLLNLDLMAFGPFTGTRLDLSAGSEGLHLIYGPNEAGKSAALRALHALLYGIPERTTDNFLHENARLRIGATVRHSDRSELAVVRRKGRKDTLLDPDGHAIDDALLRKHLSGVTAEVFSTMFGINHDVLLRGGAELVAGQGEVAHSLYAAALGIVNLRQVLKELDDEAGAIFKPRGSTQTINVLLAQHKQLKAAAAELSLPARDWQAITDRVEQASREGTALGDDLKRLGAEKARLERLRQVIPVIAERKNWLSELAAMGEVILLPPESREARLSARRILADAESRSTRARQDLVEITAKIDKLQIPEGLLAEKDAIDELHERLGSHRKAQQDKPRLAAGRDELLKEVQNILRELAGDASLDQVASYRLPVSKTARIQRLGSRYEKVCGELDRAARQRKDIAGQLANAERALQQGAEPRDAAGLKAAAKRSRRKGDLDALLADARSRAQRARAQAEADLRALPLWTGSLDQLRGIRVPVPETVDRHEASIAQVEAARAAAEARAREAREQADALRRRIDGMQAGGDVPTNAQLDAARARRETAWRLVRRAWMNSENVDDDARQLDPERDLSAAYENTVRHADHVADRLRSEADRVAELEQLQASLLECDRKCAILDAELAAASAGIEQARGEWREAWRDARIEPLPPKEMRSWLQRREKIAARAATVAEAEAEADKLAASISDERARLGACLQQLGEPPAADNELLADLLDRCDELVAGVEAAARGREKLAEKAADLSQRHATAAAEHEAAQAAFAEWRTEWSEHVSILRLLPDADPAEAAAVIDRIQKLVARFDEAQKLLVRIEGMEHDAGQFAKDAAAVAERVAPDVASLPVEQAVSELSRRLAAALANAATLEQLEQRRAEKHEALRQAEHDIAGASAAIHDLCRRASCESIDDLASVEDRSARALLLGDKIERANEQIARSSGGAAIDDFIREAEQIDADALPGQIDALDRQIDELGRQLRQVNQSIGAEREKLRAMDGSAKAAEALEAAQACVAGIRRNAERYAHLKIAAAVLERAIERYRQANQAPILTRASQIFSKLTCGAFAGLRTDYDEGDRPVIEGVRASGQAVPVHGMSDGTRDQLYLALRLASLERHVQSAEPMPFIVDDVLINFDDARSEATLEVLAELSRSTQIIFFTHHARLVELARRAVPPDTLHVQNLPAP
ncbi:MAG TPA: AAA family ATPase [Planctomycetota bacterium]|nr:AAA family ATPase [Planctomycetota bacterium]